MNCIGMTTQAVILSGGLGTRLRSVDATVPKPMIGVAGEPFLMHQIRMLKRHGIGRMLFLLGYKSEIVVDFLKRTAVSEALALEWSVEPVPLGTGGALRLAGGMVDEDFILMNGDSYLDMDYAGWVACFRVGGFDAMMTVYDNADSTDVRNNVKVGPAGRVEVYSRRGNSAVGLTHVDAGVVMMKRSVVGLVNPEGVCSMEDEVYPRLIAAKKMGYYGVSQRFYDIGTPERLKEFEGTLAKGVAAR